MKKIIPAFVLLILFLVLFTKNNSNNESKDTKNDPRTIKVAYGKFVSPFFVAEEKGFYKDEELNVELIFFPATNTTIQAVAQGEVDVATVPYSVLFAFEKSAPGKFKVFNSVIETTENPYSFLLVKEEINSTSDLAGKKIVVRAGNNGRVQAEMVLKALGVNPQTIEMVQVEPNLTAATFARDDISAAIDIEPSATTILTKGIGKILEEGVRPKYIINPYPTVANIFSTKFAAENSDLAYKFMSATEKAISFIETNDQESRKIMQKYLGIEEAVAMSMKDIVFQTSDEIDKDAIRKLMEIEYEQKLLEERVNLDKIYF